MAKIELITELLKCITYILALITFLKKEKKS